MKTIFFPSNYKKALLEKKKTMTIRVKAEIGKYKKGQIYMVKSYAGSDWGVNVRILDINLTNLKNLSHLGIPKRSIESIQRKEKINKNSRVELLKFEIVK